MNQDENLSEFVHLSFMLHPENVYRAGKPHAIGQLPCLHLVQQRTCKPQKLVAAFLSKAMVRLDDSVNGRTLFE